MKTAEERRKLREFIEENIVESKEAQEILGFSRQRLNVLVQEGRIKPIRTGIYLKDDILAYKEAFKKAREQGTWLRDFE